MKMNSVVIAAIILITTTSHSVAGTSPKKEAAACRIHADTIPAPTEYQIMAVSSQRIFVPEQCCGLCVESPLCTASLFVPLDDDAGFSAPSPFPVHFRGRCVFWGTEISAWHPMKKKPNSSATKYVTFVNPLPVNPEESAAIPHLSLTVWPGEEVGGSCPNFAKSANFSTWLVRANDPPTRVLLAKNWLTLSFELKTVVRETKVVVFGVNVDAGSEKWGTFPNNDAQLGRCFSMRVPSTSFSGITSVSFLWTKFEKDV